MPTVTVGTVDRGRHRITRRVLVPAAPEQIFALIADPHRHPELDGSGTVRDAAVDGPDRLYAGAKFTVPMRQYGVPYKITSTVTAFEEDRLVEWQHPAGHRWRWELVELEPGVTEVTETFDYTTSKSAKVLRLLGQPGKNAAGISQTLERLATRFA
jgi:hypothetical protein